MAKVKTSAVAAKQTKSQIINEIAEATDVSKADIKAVIDSLAIQAGRHLGPRGCGEFMVPGLGIKMKTVKKPATKARPGRNPFTGEDIIIKAKKASKSVRAVTLKAAKEMAG